MVPGSTLCCRNLETFGCHFMDLFSFRSGPVAHDGHMSNNGLHHPEVALLDTHFLRNFPGGFGSGGTG